MEEEKKLNNVKLILIIIVLISVTLYIVLNNLENNNETNTSSEVDNTNIVDDSEVPSVGAPIAINVTNETSRGATNITKQEDTTSRTDIQRYEETVIEKSVPVENVTKKSVPVEKNESKDEVNIKTTTTR